MKIERISENQIRCTLYKTDLAEKELLLTELAYGTDKAKQLFREMMQQASDELGFEVDNIPLMIEAIPVSPECLVLIVTKVEDPEELDTRFSRFTKNIEIDDDSEEDDEDISEEDEQLHKKHAGSLLEKLGSLAESLSSLGAAAPKPVSPSEAKNIEKAVNDKVFVFRDLNKVITVAKLVDGKYDGWNTLYKSPKTNQYFLYLQKEQEKDGAFKKVCSVISEYGVIAPVTSYATSSHFEEHFKVIIEDVALQTLAKI